MGNSMLNLKGLMQHFDHRKSESLSTYDLMIKHPYQYGSITSIPIGPNPFLKITKVEFPKH